MNAGTYKFKVGDFDCVAVSDGSCAYAPPMFPPPAEFLFVNAPSSDVSRALSRHGLHPLEWKAWRSDYTCLLVDTGSSLVLIDTGAGGLGPDTGNLMSNLASLGIGAEQIDLVILTHGHADHLGGNADAGGGVLFPNARWVMSKTEWEFWMEGQAEAVLPEHVKEVLVGLAQRNLSPIKDQVDLVPGEKEIVAGVRILAAPGHTPGHCALSVSSAGEELLCLGDLLLHPVHLEEPGWFAGVDMLPEHLLRMRRELLALAVKEKSLVMVFHFPFPGVGRVVPWGENWQWEPQA